MIEMTLAEIADVVGGMAYGDATITAGAFIDTRTPEKGGLFVAVAGERVDGHDFVEQAVAAGAAAVLHQVVDQTPDHGQPGHPDQLVDQRHRLGDQGAGALLVGAGVVDPEQHQAHLHQPQQLGQLGAQGGGDLDVRAVQHLAQDAEGGLAGGLRLAAFDSSSTEECCRPADAILTLSV